MIQKFDSHEFQLSQQIIDDYGAAVSRLVQQPTLLTHPEYMRILTIMAYCGA